MKLTILHKLFKSYKRYSFYRGSVFYGKEVEKWCLPFMGADPSVVRRTQRYKHEELNESTLQYGAYFTMPSLIYVGLFMFFGFIFSMLASYEFGRKLLEKVRKLFQFASQCYGCFENYWQKSSGISQSKIVLGVRQSKIVLGVKLSKIVNGKKYSKC